MKLNEVTLELTDEQTQWIERVVGGSWHYKAGKVNVDSNVELSGKELTSIPVQFGYVTGWFDCSDNNLTSLKGCPVEVGDWFACSYTH